MEMEMEMEMMMEMMMMFGAMSFFFLPNSTTGNFSFATISSVSLLVFSCRCSNFCCFPPADASVCSGKSTEQTAVCSH
eukprot:654175-Hanusia_phi.AAC.1